MKAGGPAVVAIGGGHGLAITLRAVRTYAGSLTAVVATSDDGGSSGRLRDDLGVAAPGDLRRCLTAVAADRELAEAFEHRFDRGELAGHCVGNLVIAGLVDAGVGLVEASDRIGGWLGTGGVRVVPATEVPVTLVAEAADGRVTGQDAVKRSTGITRVDVDPPDPAVPAAALAALAAADQVILGPGSLYTSVLAACVPGVRTALSTARAQVVLVCNLRSVEPESRGYDVAAHVLALRRHGVEPDVVVVQAGAIPLGDVAALDPAELVVADVDRPHRLAHDPALLGPALARVASRVV